jgi:hypothetical protein
MSTQQFDKREDDDDRDDEPKLIPVKDLPWYETLRIMLEPYEPLKANEEADKTFTSAEIISFIEQHHGVPQGPIGKEIREFVYADDFVRAMRYLGFYEVNAGDLQLHWVMRRKKRIENR